MRKSIPGLFKSTRAENQKTGDVNAEESNKSADINDAWQIGASGSTGKEKEKEKEKGFSDILMNDNPPGSSNSQLREETSANQNFKTVSFPNHENVKRIYFFLITPKMILMSTL